MTDYKRMISYMYQYENGVKKKNVGYARIEAKNGLCKLTLHMQLLGQLDSIFPTYLIHRDEKGIELIYLGDSQLKNQIIDSKLTANEANIMDSGFKLTDMGGLLLFLNDSVFFASEWDDQPIRVNEVLNALKPKKTTVVTIEKESGNLSAADLTDTGANKPVVAGETITFLSPEGLSLAEELNIPKYRLPRGWKTVERLQKTVAKPNEQKDTFVEAADVEGKELISDSSSVEASNNSQYRQQEPSVESGQDGFEIGEVPDQALHQETLEELQEATGQGLHQEFPKELLTDFEQEPKEEPLPESGEEPEQESEEEPWTEPGEGPVQEKISDVIPEDKEQEPENPTAKNFFDNYPRIYPFEDNEILVCVKIEPKDIGMLPKDTWALSNNSFLMHGYYCYHHLIFAKLKNHNGCRYILGVPGIYHNRERFMARMFGLENFKSIRKRELRQGDFGYWYLEIFF